MKPNNIITWFPWSWKTTIWKEFAIEIWSNFYDFDDDILEKINLETAEKALWVLKLRKNNLTPEDISNQEVKYLLEKLWDEDFLNLEWYIWGNLNFKNPTVLATSWSLPLKLMAMKHLRKQWNVWYLNIPIESIIKRLQIMKTDRIIWMWKKTINEILKDREDFYHISSDFNFIVKDDFPETNNSKQIKEQQGIIFEKFMNFYKEKQKWKY